MFFIWYSKSQKDQFFLKEILYGIVNNNEDSTDLKHNSFGPLF